MLYYLFNQFHVLPGARLMTYYSFRAIVAWGLALFLSLWLCKYFILFMKRRKISETQRDERLDPFNTGKVGVPTMGGIIILISILSACLLVGDLSNIYMLLLIVVTILLGIVGFADDYIKTFRHNKEGLNPWLKIVGQVLVGLIIGLTLRYAPQCVMHETVNTRFENNVSVTYKSPAVKSTRTTIPFFKNHNCNYADMFSFLGNNYKYKLGWIFFVILTVFVILSVSNGANLNDGMDGMCTGNCSIIGIALLILTYVSGDVRWSDYFDIMYIPDCGELVVFVASFIGALIGFLWWNSYPAQIFMGDTGSLTIGGIIGAVAVVIHKELLLPLMCLTFLIESLSVILQTSLYKYYKKRGKHFRLWKRTPIHDHFRTSLSQVNKIDPSCVVFFKGSGQLHFETKIVMRFWVVTLICVVLTILTLKIR